MHRLLLVATPEDAPRVKALSPSRPDLEARLVAPRDVGGELEGGWDAIVIGLAPRDPEIVAAIDVVRGRPIPILALADAHDAEVAALAARCAARLCLYAHGPGPFAAMIEGVGALVDRRRRLIASERIHRVVASNVGDVVFLLGVEPDGFRFLEINPGFTRATGLPEEAVIGKRVEQVIPEPSLSLVLERYRASIAARTPLRWAEITPYPTGTKHGDVSITPIFEGDVCTHLIGTVHDVTELREAEAQLRALTARVESAREEERTGIARELHDQLGQTLTAINMDLAWVASRARSASGLSTESLVAKIGDLRALCDQTIDQMRRISAELRPPVLDDLGLSAAVTWEGAEFEKRTGIPCVVRADTDDADLGRDVTTAVFRILQEVLTNVARHADARRVDVALDRSQGELRLSVHDDGRGIQLDEIDRRTSLGILGIRERARRIGGTASFTPTDPGTRVTLSVPLSAP